MLISEAKDLLLSIKNQTADLAAHQLVHDAIRKRHTVKVGCSLAQAGLILFRNKITQHQL
jgi:hypothetical protein